MGTTNYVARPRYRERGMFTPIISGFDKIDETCSSGTVTSFYGTTAEVGTFQRMWDQVNPKFSKRSREGQFVTGPLRLLKEEQTCSGEFAKFRDGSTPSCPSPVKYLTYDHHGPQAFWRASFGNTKIGRPLLIADSDIKAAIAVASTGAWDKSNEHSADVLVDIAEIRKTLNMLRDPIQTSSTLLRKLKTWKGVGSIGFKDYIDYANSMWLQYRYGVRPLVKSVQGVIQALDKVRKRQAQTSRGKYSLKQQSLVNASYLPGSVQFDYSTFSTDEVVIRTGLVLDVEVSLRQSLGVDASGMLALPWELVPYSFVADWVFNVNQWLGALTPYLTQTPLSSWTTVERTSSSVFNVTNTSCTAPWILERPIVETRSGVFYEKTRSPSLSGPSLTWKPQAIQNVLSDLRVVDSFALFAQQFGKIFRR